MNVYLSNARPSPDQSEKILELIHRATAEDGTAPLSEQAVRLITADGSASHVLALIDDRIVGYGVTPAPRDAEQGDSTEDGDSAEDGDTAEEAFAEAVVDPEHRGRGVGTALVDALVQGPTRIWAHGQLPSAVRVAEKLALRNVRELVQMRRPTSETLPELVIGDGIAVRTYRPGDDAEILRVNNAAFAWHPEQGGWTQDDIDQRRAEAWFDAEGLFVATEVSNTDVSNTDVSNTEVDKAERILGFHWTKVHQPEGRDPKLGEVYVVGIDPSAQGKGLGRILTLAGLHYLARDESIPAVMLYVEADNVAAVHTYDRLGFTRFHTDVAYAR